MEGKRSVAWKTWPLVALFTIAAGCGNDMPPDTGLAGVALRGPTQPVCSESDPCEEPFAATFNVMHGGRLVRQFSSAGDGTFVVVLAPGSYRVVPTPNAPVLSPTSQFQDVVVGDRGLTTDTLRFDTGIR